MKTKIRILTSLAVLTLLLTACPNRAAPPPDDTTPPEVQSSSPTDGAQGVTKTAQVSVSFSEPMDTAATEAAFELRDADGNPVAVTLSWTDGNKRLLAAPAAPLAYSDGSDYLTYTYSVGTDAADAAGNHLESAYAASFSTMRRLGLLITGEAVRDGEVTSGGDVDTSAGNAFLGDLDATNASRVFISFSLADLPAGTESVISAELRLYSGSSTGSPGTLNFHMDHLAYGDLDAGDYDAAESESLPIFLHAIGSWKFGGMQGWVTSDLNAHRSSFQVRLRSDNNGTTGPDGYGVSTADATNHKPELSIVVYAP